MWRSVASTVAAVLLLGNATTCQATVPLDAALIAGRDCPALASIKRGSNPGNLTLTPGTRYPVIGKNRADASHYLLRLDNRPSVERWVAVDCGRLVGGDDPAAADAAADAVGTDADASAAVPATATNSDPTASRLPPTGPSRVTAIPLILAASWQNAFCEYSRRRPECRALDANDAAAQRFSLHGLWPQPIGNAYCGASARDRADSRDGRWRDLPRVELTRATRGRLDALMPGTRSYLQRHQWTKHGTCYGTDPETYFDDALELIEQLNASPVRALFADSIGQHLSASEIRAAFSQAFGRSAGERLRLKCNNGLITELRISLKGPPGSQASLSDWLRTAPTKSGGCRGGHIDEAGVQRSPQPR